MIAYSFHPEAEVELSEAARFYEIRVKGLGRLFSAEVERTISFIRAYPHAGKALRLPVRRTLVDRFPYAVVYRHDDQSIVILAIAHLRRRPGYWKPRE